MSFLAPLYLALASAVAVPLLLHLLRRRIGLKVEFPSARYIARAERENSRKLRLRNLLLMFLRIAAVLLLAFAAARPIGRVVGAGHVPTALAIVVDNSLSTSVIEEGAPLFNRLRSAALDALRDAGQTDRIWIVTADSRVVGGSTASVGDALRRLEPIAGRGDLAAAMARAAGLVRGAGLAARHVAVVTDAQASAWNAVGPEDGIRVSLLIPAEGPPPNHAVTFAEARPARWTPRGAVVARTAGADSATYRIALGERTLARGTAGDGEVLVRAAPPERGWIAGSVELEPDELRGDDVRYFAVWLGLAPAVTVDPSTGPFVRNAVDALVQNERLRAGTDVAIVSAEQLTQLPALIVAPSDPVRAGAANRALERAGVPWRFGTMRQDVGTARETSASAHSVDGATVARRFPLTLVGAATVDTLARVGAEPWIVAGERYVLIASPIDPTTTNFPVRAGFLPWLADAISQRLSGDAGPSIAATPGSRVHLPASVQELEDPTHQVTAVSSTDIPAPERPGVYFLRQRGVRAGALVINADPEESDLRRLAASALRTRLHGRQVTVTNDPRRWSGAAFDVSSERPLTTAVLAIAVLLLLVESAVARAGGRPGGAGTGARAAA